MTDEQVPHHPEPPYAGPSLWAELRASGLLFLLALVVTAGFAGLLHLTAGALG